MFKNIELVTALLPVEILLNIINVLGISSCVAQFSEKFTSCALCWKVEHFAEKLHTLLKSCILWWKVAHFAKKLHTLLKSCTLCCHIEQFQIFLKVCKKFRFSKKLIFFIKLQSYIVFCKYNVQFSEKFRSYPVFWNVENWHIFLKKLQNCPVLMKTCFLKS